MSAELLVIIPTFNEASNIVALTQAVLEHNPDVHLLIVDDNSPDGTGEMADRLSDSDGRIHVLHRENKEGLGRAYIAGFRWALERSYTLIMEMDCDFSHDPKAIPLFREEIANGHDLVLGSRYIDGVRVMNWPLSRLLLSRGAGIYVQLVTGMPFTDPTGGFKCFHRTLLEAYKLDSIEASGYGFQIELTHIAWREGYRIKEIPIIFEDRQSGDSKMSSSIVYEALWVVWKLALRHHFRRSPRTRST